MARGTNDIIQEHFIVMIAAGLAGFVSGLWTAFMLEIYPYIYRWLYG